MSLGGVEKTVRMSETRLSGSAFQILAAATGKARLQTEDSLYDGTTRRLVAEERRGRRSAM